MDTKQRTGHRPLARAIRSIAITGLAVAIGAALVPAVTPAAAALVPTTPRPATTGPDVSEILDATLGAPGATVEAPRDVPAVGTGTSGTGQSVEPAPASDPVPVPAFTSPVVAGYVRTTDRLVVAWTESNGEAVVTRTLAQEQGPIDAAGECEETRFTRTWVASVATTRHQASDLAAETCYRWSVRVVNADGHGRTTTSPVVRVVAPWSGTEDTYRDGVFSSQKLITWCTAASVQMIVNITRSEDRHAARDQKAIWRYEQRHDRYPDGVARGSDPQGWAAALRHYGASPAYRWNRSSSLEDALRVAARRIRVTGKPVGLAVMDGNHAWVMTGFSATADPAVTDDYTVTAVNVLGPLYPREADRGFDPAPDTRLDAATLGRYFRPYHDNLGPTYSVWEGSWVTILP